MFGSLLLLIGTCITASLAYPEGAPYKICATMTPGDPHDRHGGAQNSTAPYIIDFGGTTHFIPGTPVKGEIKDRLHKKTFRGFMLRVFDEYGNSYGQVTRVNVHDARSMQCTNPTDTLTHVNHFDKSDVYFNWHPPANAASHAVFKLTVVQTEYVYWVGITNSLMKGNNPNANGTASMVGGPALVTIGLVLALALTRHL